MITVFVGQRGTGKSSLLKRIQIYLQNRGAAGLCVDLDETIAAGEAKSIQQIFSHHGEAHFRELEKKYFFELIAKATGTNLFIAVGGGFSPEYFNSSMRVVYLQRESDQIGRIFLNRPALESQLSPLQEYFVRAQARRPGFLKAAWEEYLIPEGLVEPSLTEEAILLGEPSLVGGILTLLPHHFNTHVGWRFFIDRRLRWGLNFFEIRDDLLSAEQIEQALSIIPKEKLLWARRTKDEHHLFDPRKVGAVDYDESLLAETLQPAILPVDGQMRIVSVHYYQEGESLSQLLTRMARWESQGYHLKVAVEISDFQQLEQGHQWQLQNSSGRSFLPRSSDGRWLWYRLLKGVQQKINFFREGEGSAADQPSLYQWLDAVKDRDNLWSSFAALLGDPVVHSYTPIFQEPFFRGFHLPIVPIKVNEEEFTEAFFILERLGLVAAAVTSPLKKRAFALCKTTTSVATHYQSVNTLVKNQNQKWQGHNTDVEGMQAMVLEAERLCSEFSSKQTVVWGGGGTLAMLKSVLPQARFFSAQTGLDRDSQADRQWQPQFVVWAAGLLAAPGCHPPPREWAPRLVIDLNYREDSGGREFAQRTGAQYLSGEIMFYEQGHYQRLFWRPILEALFGDL